MLQHGARCLSRSEALSLSRTENVVVEFPVGGSLQVTPFTPESPFYSGHGPYVYSDLRYYLLEDGEASRTVHGGGGGGQPAKPDDPPDKPAPEEPPKPTPTLKGKFKTTPVPCGDSVDLQLDGTDLPPNSNAAVDLKTVDGDKALSSVNGPLTGQSGTLQWISKKPSATWGKPEVYFSAEAGGAKAKSDNQLEFKKYADAASETKTFNCTSGIYGWTGKFDIEFKSGVLKVLTKVKLINRQGAKPASSSDPMPAAGPAVSDADKTSMKADVEGKLSGKWMMHRKACKRTATCDCDKSYGCCKFKVEVHIDFVESGEHHVVNLFQGAGRANSGNWTRVKTRDNSWAHETGHLLAWYDEYTGGAVGTAPRWTAPNAGAVMETGLKVPFEYYWDFRDWLKSKISEDLEGIA
jgi:hypothetical protein